MKRYFILITILVYSLSILSKEVKLPEWFYNVPQEDGFMYAVGISDECETQEIAQKQADQRGQALMSLLYKSEINGEVIIYQITEYDPLIKIDSSFCYALGFDTIVKADLLSAISIETVKRFNYGKHVSISLCRMDLENVYKIETLKVFARSYKSDKMNKSYSSFLSLFVYDDIKNLFLRTSGFHIFNYLDRVIENFDDIDAEMDSLNINGNGEVFSILLNIPYNQVYNHDYKLSKPLFYGSIFLEIVNERRTHIRDYSFKTANKLNYDEINNADNKLIEFPDWFDNITSDSENNSFFGSATLEYEESNLASLYFEALIDALSKNAQYKEQKIEGFEKNNDTKLKLLISSSFEDNIKFGQIIQTDFRYRDNYQKFFMQLDQNKIIQKKNEYNNWNKF